MLEIDYIFLKGANDNGTEKALADIFPQKDNVEYIDDHRPTHCKKMVCCGCGYHHVYAWPVTWAVSDIQCDRCGSYGTLTEPFR